MVRLLQLLNLHTHHYHPESIVYIRAHTSCCMFYGFEQTYDTYPTLQYHIEYFHCPKNPLFSSYSSLSPPSPWQPRLFLLQDGFFLVLLGMLALRTRPPCQELKQSLEGATCRRSSQQFWLRSQPTASINHQT